jgi:hypothetical protein
VFGDMVTSGAYAFNAAHCAAYGLISYYTAYLKVYDPDVFYAAALARVDQGQGPDAPAAPRRAKPRLVQAASSSRLPTSQVGANWAPGNRPRASDDIGWLPVRRGDR